MSGKITVFFTWRSWRLAWADALTREKLGWRWAFQVGPLNVKRRV